MNACYPGIRSGLIQQQYSVHISFKKRYIAEYTYHGFIPVPQSLTTPVQSNQAGRAGGVNVGTVAGKIKKPTNPVGVERS